MKMKTLVYAITVGTCMIAQLANAETNQIMYERADVLLNPSITNLTILNTATVFRTGNHCCLVGNADKVLSDNDIKTYSTATEDQSSKKRSGMCAVFSLGYGHLTTSESEWGHPEEVTWGAVAPGIGIGWRGGRGQLFLEFILTGSHNIASTGWYDWDYEEYFFGIILALRHCLIGPVFGSVGYGIIGRYISGGHMGTTSDNFPIWTFGFDIEIMQRDRLSVFAGVQKYNVTGHDDHPAPDWNFLSLSLTLVVRR